MHVLVVRVCFSRPSLFRSSILAEVAGGRAGPSLSRFRSRLREFAIEPGYIADELVASWGSRRRARKIQAGNGGTGAGWSRTLFEKFVAWGTGDHPKELSTSPSIATKLLLPIFFS